MSIRGEDLTSLRRALAAVERRLIARDRVRAAAIAAVGLAGPAAVLVPGPIGGAVVALGAALAATWVRPVGGQAARWLDRHGADDDLMISGAAAADGRVATALSDDVMVAAQARLTTTRRPSGLPVVAGALAVAGLTAAIGLAGRPGATGGARGAEVAAAERGAFTAVRGDEPAGGAVDPGAGDRAGAVRAGAAIVGGAQDDEPGAARGAGAGAGAAATVGDPGRGDRGALVDGAGAGVGAGAGDRGALRSTTGVGPAVIAPTAARGALATSAPRAGASAEVVAVPARYRALVTAYLARRPGGGA